MFACSPWWLFNGDFRWNRSSLCRKCKTTWRRREALSPSTIWDPHAAWAGQHDGRTWPSDEQPFFVGFLTEMDGSFSNRSFFANDMVGWRCVQAFGNELVYGCFEFGPLHFLIWGRQVDGVWISLMSRAKPRKKTKGWGFLSKSFKFGMLVGDFLQNWPKWMCCQNTSTKFVDAVSVKQRYALACTFVSFIHDYETTSDHQVDFVSPDCSYDANRSLIGHSLTLRIRQPSFLGVLTCSCITKLILWRQPAILRYLPELQTSPPYFAVIPTCFRGIWIFPIPSDFANLLIAQLHRVPNLSLYHQLNSVSPAYFRIN